MKILKPTVWKISSSGVTFDFWTLKPNDILGGESNSSVTSCIKYRSSWLLINPITDGIKKMSITAPATSTESGGWHCQEIDNFWF